MKIAKYGWIPDFPDHRDITFKIGFPVTLPSSIDLRPDCPPVVSQGELGSCTANSIANAHYFDQMKQNKAKPFMPSRLFIYYNERVIENTVPYDSGAQIRDGIKTLNAQGVCSEETWKYIIPKFTKKPSPTAYKQALLNQSILYQRLSQTPIDLKQCLFSGYPFIFGFTVYESFESEIVTKTGIIPMPSLYERALGGHAVLCVGYNDNTSRFTVMNSWGTEWGDKGYFYIPYSYLLNTNLSSDFWTVKSVE